uniref:Ig-like domain-containing protein n=1 Tax=Denticeps clupeoides TaxID=299321 RepID=A0AAY4CU38_9TELE
MAYFTMKHNWTAFALLLLTFQVVSGQRVRVDLEVEAYPMETINLRCTFASGGTSTKLTQVSWIFEATEGKRENIAVFHPQYGESFPTTSFSNRVKFTYGSLENPSIEISDMKMSDAGKYTCEFATYPSGNEQATTSVVMLANPKNSGTPVTVTAGSAPVVVATCEAAQGKPAATINWVSSASGTPNTTSKAEPDGTVTVRSEYRMVPTAADNGQDISCEITQRTQDKPQVFPMKLSVEYPPVVKIEGYDDNWYKGRTDAGLTCQADANPKADVTWRVASGEVPATVQLDGSRLMVKKVDDNTNTTFVCEAKNKLGSTKAELATFVRESTEVPSNSGVLAGAIIGSLLALLLVAALVAVLVTRSRRQQQRGYPANGDSVTYGNIFASGGHKKTSKNGANNNGPVYTYREGDHGQLTEKANEFRPSGGPPGAHDILLSSEMDEAERRKFDTLDDSQEEYEEEAEVVERYEGFGRLPPAYHACPPLSEQARDYLDNNMESQRDGSVISRTAIYV